MDWDPKKVDKRAFLKEYAPVVESALRSYGGNDPALRTRARIMALQALKTYNPSKNVALKTHVYNTLHGLSRFSRGRREPVRIPEQWSQDFDRVARVEAQITSEKGRAATMLELADKLSIPVERIKMIKARIPKVKPEAVVTSEKGELVSRAGDDNPLKAWSEFVYHDLDDVDKKIFEMGTGYGGAKVSTRADIAKKLGISSPAVSQRISKITSKLEEGLQL